MSPTRFVICFRTRRFGGLTKRWVFISILPPHHTTGHFTYECKDNTRPYISRPSRTAQLENPRLVAKSKADGQPSVDVPEEFKNKFVVFFFFSVLRLWHELVVDDINY
jgi:hypothetical protein